MKFAKFEYKHFLFYALWLLLAINLGQTTFSLLCSHHILFDDVEHLRAAYFISLGDVPYRDFFEHHHPLLWYMLAPFISFFPHETVPAIYSGRLISLIISLISGFYVYKTEKKFIGGTLCALFCLNLYFWGDNAISVTGLFHVKPDIYQRCCFFIGLYYLFCYFRYQKFRHLQICALLWTMAFLFLQTTVFYVFPMVVPVGYFLYKNPQRWSDFAKASAVPIAIIVCCLVTLWQSGALTRYFETNWIFNKVYGSVWAHTTDNYFVWVNILDVLLIFCAALVFFIYKKKINIYMLTLVSGFVGELLLRMFFVSHYYYLVWLVIYASMFAAPAVTKICLKFKVMFLPFIAVWAIHFNSNLQLVDCKEFSAFKYYISQTEGETVCSKVFTDRYSYYWMYPMLVEGLDDVLFHPVADYDLEDVYRQRNSGILICPPIKDRQYQDVCKALNLNIEQKAILQRHVIDDFVKEYYIKIKKNIYQRKDAISPDETEKK